MRKLLILVSLFVSCHFLFGQNVHYAKNVIDTLSSATMAGRGYTNDGLKKASDYIRNEFTKQN